MAATHNFLPLWFRIYLAIHSAFTGLLSLVADGCLQMNILPYDQKNAVLFCALLGALCIILFPRMEWYWILLTLFFAILALVNFHRRLFETYVSQRWDYARMCARLWHIFAILMMLCLWAGSF